MHYNRQRGPKWSTEIPGISIKRRLQTDLSFHSFNLPVTCCMGMLKYVPSIQDDGQPGRNICDRLPKACHPWRNTYILKTCIYIAVSSIKYQSLDRSPRAFPRALNISPANETAAPYREKKRTPDGHSTRGRSRKSRTAFGLSPLARLNLFPPSDAHAPRKRGGVGGRRRHIVSTCDKFRGSSASSGAVPDGTRRSPGLFPRSAVARKHRSCDHAADRFGGVEGGVSVVGVLSFLRCWLGRT